jgi:hypothetical protein
MFAGILASEGDEGAVSPVRRTLSDGWKDCEGVKAVLKFKD